jgi:hypothetical protein
MKAAAKRMRRPRAVKGKSNFLVIGSQKVSTANRVSTNQNPVKWKFPVDDKPIPALKPPE